VCIYLKKRERRGRRRRKRMKEENVDGNYTKG
jgi:hypothetical protein